MNLWRRFVRAAIAFADSWQEDAGRAKLTREIAKSYRLEKWSGTVTLTPEKMAQMRRHGLLSDT